MRSIAPGALVLLLAFAVPLHAKPCGSDVDGHGTVVPCDCGDLLVSSHGLSPADPVTQHACPGDGLVVRIPATVATATLSLGGQTLGGTMHGVGLKVLAGGASGLVVTGPGVVQNFGIGLFAAPGALQSATDVLAVGNATDGFAVTGRGFAIRTCEASRNGRDGFALRGAQFAIDGTRATANGRFGYCVNGRDAGIGGELGTEAMGNARDGYDVRGRGTALRKPVATANVRRGLRTRLAQGRVEGAVSQGNFAAQAPDAAPRCDARGACR